MHCDNILVNLKKQTSESEQICVFSVRSATASEYFLSIKQKVLPRLQNTNFSIESQTDFAIVYIRLDLQS